MFGMSGSSAVILLFDVRINMTRYHRIINSADFSITKLEKLRGIVEWWAGRSNETARKMLMAEFFFFSLHRQQSTDNGCKSEWNVLFVYNFYNFPDEILFKVKLNDIGRWSVDDIFDYRNGSLSDMSYERIGLGPLLWLEYVLCVWSSLKIPPNLEMRSIV